MPKKARYFEQIIEAKREDDPPTLEGICNKANLFITRKTYSYFNQQMEFAKNTAKTAQQNYIKVQQQQQNNNRSLIKSASVCSIIKENKQNDISEIIKLKAKPNAKNYSSVSAASLGQREIDPKVMIRQFMAICRQKQQRLQKDINKYDKIIQLSIELSSKQCGQSKQVKEWIEQKVQLLYQSIIDDLERDITKPKVQKDLSCLAFAYSSKATLKISQKRSIRQITSCADKAIAIYDQSISDYFEEKITLLSNLGVYYSSNSKLNEAISKFNQALQLQDKYFERKDERRLINLNNYACALCKKGQNSKGKKMFEQIIRMVDTDSQIYKLFKNNYDYYKNVK